MILSLFIALTMIFVATNFKTVAAQQTVEDQYWDLVKNSTKAEDFQKYLKEYPNGKYASIARLKGGQNGSPAANYLITENSVGNLQIGMKLNQAKQILRTAKFAPFDCNCAGQFDSISVSQNGKIIMTLSINDENQTINNITSRDSGYKLTNGIHPEMSISEAEKVYGKFKELYTAYDTEFVKFANQPDGFKFIVTGKGKTEAGNYKNWKGGDPREKYADKYNPGAYISAIAVTGSNQNEDANYLITANSVGNIRLGMTIAEARKAMSDASFSRTSDGEGIALIKVGNSDEIYMTLYAGEENSEAPINENAVIESIEVWDSQFKTAEGVSPKMNVNVVESIYGKVKNIMTSEIESREYAEFSNQPKFFNFRLLSASGDSAGIYPNGKRETTKYRADSYIFTISISTRRTIDE